MSSAASASVRPDAARDALLAGRAARGESAAFAELYDRHAAIVLAHAERLLGPGDEAGAAAVEAWERALAAAPTEDLSFRAALLRASHGRIAARRQPTPWDAEGVAAAAARLSPRRREALVLADLAGLTLPEAGAVMGVGTAEAGLALARARLALYDELRGGPGPAGEDACEDILPTLAADQSGELPDGPRARDLDAHLLDCDGCQMAREAMAEAQVAYRAWAPAAPGPGLRADVAAAAGIAAPPATAAYGAGEGPTGLYEFEGEFGEEPATAAYGVGEEPTGRHEVEGEFGEGPAGPGVGREPAGLYGVEGEFGEGYGVGDEPAGLYDVEGELGEDPAGPGRAASASGGDADVLEDAGRRRRGASAHDARPLRRPRRRTFQPGEEDGERPLPWRGEDRPARRRTAGPRRTVAVIGDAGRDVAEEAVLPPGEPESSEWGADPEPAEGFGGRLRALAARATAGLAAARLPARARPRQAATAAPAFEEPAVGEPVVDAPDLDRTVVGEPVVDAPDVDRTVGGQPPVDAPAVDEPGFDRPPADETATDQPTVDEPALERPAFQSPVADDEAAGEEPSAREPAIGDPSAHDRPAGEPAVGDPPADDRPAGEPAATSAFASTRTASHAAFGR
ncbi:MAG TPA: sigma factor-like helix-turn-helix DNA-binding protein, partial [Solirubrobacteraceae bacterium]|nr:sigma factor-like helix-turn-helix DNA-binding protein [Solirubrobacteraceae bacterium]